jgi:hypothetical protein
MRRFFVWQVALAGLLAAPITATAGQSPHIGYIYPAGGQQGTVVEATVGGQYLAGVSGAYVSGKGVQIQVIKHRRLLTQGQVNSLRMRLVEITKYQRLISAAREEDKPVGNLGLFLARAKEQFATAARKAGIPEGTPEAFAEAQRDLADPKRQPNAQLGERVTLKLTFAPDAPPGEREMRLKTPGGFTNPIYLHVGQCREYREKEPNDRKPDGDVLRIFMADLDIWVDEPLPVVVNGQIMPGDVDRFRFEAKKGTRLVAAVSARRLVPYLADAVPGWFQATLKLMDAKGKELAFSDDFRFDPDPVIYYEIPEDGEYMLEIQDSIYRGREDFVYRIVLGEVPLLTSIFPLGGRAGEPATVNVEGWNLPVQTLTVDAKNKQPCVLPVCVSAGKRASNAVPFALDALPECVEAEPNNDRRKAQRTELPLVVNGRIDRPGDWDVFRFKGKEGDEIVAEVYARRLGSPLDSLVKLTDSSGEFLAANDDHEDKGYGLTTHHADSLLSYKLPKNGTYLLHIGDTQKKGGSDYAYRLRIGPRRPDFRLRVVPSSIHVRPGETVPITVYALRQDGFDGEIALNVEGMPKGFQLGSGLIRPGVEKLRLTMTTPPVAQKRPVDLRVEGRATIDGTEVRRTAVPAEDTMQAFLYRHLVATRDGMVTIAGPPKKSPKVQVLAKGPVNLPVGGTAKVILAGPKGEFAERLRLELNDPPKGLAIKEVKPDPKGVAFLLTADGKDVKPGLKGNLIVDAFTETEVKDADGKPTGQKRRNELGTLVAIPFETTGKPEVTQTASKPPGS